jgi:uncharacterized membrane protein
LPQLASWLLGTEFTRFTSRFVTEAWAFARILLAVAVAVGLERGLAPLSWASDSPMPVLPAVVACYVLTASYGRMVSACVLAGLFRDAFSPAVPMGSSSLLFLLVAVVAREVCDRRRQMRLADDMLAGFLLAAGVGFLGHVVLVSSGVGGHAGVADVLRRVLGGAFVAGVCLVPALRPAKAMIGHGLHGSVRGLGSALALLGTWSLRRLSLLGHRIPHLSDDPVPARS